MSMTLVSSCCNCGWFFFLHVAPLLSFSRGLFKASILVNRSFIFSLPGAKLGFGGPPSSYGPMGSGMKKFENL